MSFPNSYKGRFVYSKDVEGSVKAFKLHVEQQADLYKINSVEINENVVNVVTNYSLVNFKYSFSVLFDPNDRKTAVYEVQLFVIFKIIVFLIPFIALFSKFSISDFFIFLTIICSLFYLLNFWFIHSFINKLLLSYFDKQAELAENTNYENIQTDKCPACGNLLTNDFFCDDCGLMFSNKKWVSNSDATKYKHKRIKYTYTAKGK